MLLYFDVLLVSDSSAERHLCIFPSVWVTAVSVSRRRGALGRRARASVSSTQRGERLIAHVMVWAGRWGMVESHPEHDFWR